MKIVYILLSALVLLKVFRRRFDFLSLSAVFFILYTSSCVIGHVWITGGETGLYYDSNIDIKTYLLVCLQLIIILISLFVSLRLKKGDRPTDPNETHRAERDSYLFWNMLLMFCCFCFVYSIFFQIGLAQFFSYTRKTTITSQLGPAFSLGIWGSLVCFTHALQYNKKTHLFVSSLLILTTVILGSRAYFATAIIILLLMKYKEIGSAVKGNIRIAILGIIAIFLLLVYKKIYSAARALDFSAVINAVKDPETYMGLFDISEWRINMSVYNYIVTTGFSLSIKDSLARALSIIPLINDVLPTTVPIRLSTIVQEQLFRSSYGLASCFWAETYSMGGILLLAVVTILWAAVMKKCSRSFANLKASSAFIITGATYCGFYIHRLDWVQVAGCVKNMVLFFIVWAFMTRLNFGVVRISDDSNKTISSI